MTILNPTDAAKALITPDRAMLVRLEHPDGSPAGRMTLAGLAALLATSTSLGGTVPTPTSPPTPVVLPAITASPIAPASSIGFTVGAASPLPIANLAPAGGATWPAGTTLDIAPPDGCVVLNSAGTQMLVGLTAAAAGTLSYAVTARLAGSASVTLLVLVVVAPPAVVVPPPLTFTGPAGPLPASLGVTQLQANPLTGLGLDGNGALLLPSQTFAYAMLKGLGAIDDSLTIIKAAGAPQPLDLVVFSRVAADGTGGVAVVFQGEYGHGTVYGVDPAHPLFQVPAVFSELDISMIGQTVTVTVDGIVAYTASGPTSPASGFIGIGSSSLASPQVKLASLQVLTGAQIAAAQAQAAAAAAAAAQAAILRGNPVANPGADGYATGIYGPDTVIVAAGSYGTRTYGNWFARLPTGGAQQWSLTGAAGSIGMYLGGTSGTSLTEYGVGAANGTYPGVLTVTDGHSTLTKSISVVVQATAVIPGGCFILDTNPVNPYGNGSGDPLAKLFTEAPTDQFAGGTATFADPNGLLGWDRQGLNQIWVEAAGRPISAHYGPHTGAAFTSPSGTQPFTYYFLQEQPAGLTFQPVPAYTYAQAGDVFGRLLASSDAGIAAFAVVSTDTPLSIGTDGTIRYLAAPALGAGGAVHLRVTSKSGVTTDTTVSNPAQASTTLDASRMTVSLLSNLDNSMGTNVAPGPVTVGTAQVSGMTAPAWSIKVPGEFPVSIGGTPTPTFTIAPRAGSPLLADIRANFLSGQTYQVQVTAAEGVNICRPPAVPLTVADVNGTGPTIQVVPGAAGSATQAPSWNAALDIYWNAPAASKGMTVQLPGGVYAMPTDGDGTLDFHRHGIGHGNNQQFPPGPYTLRGPADTSNPAIITLNGAPGLSAQGGLIAQGGDVRFINLMVKNASNLNAGEGNAGAFYKTGENPHNLLMQDCKAYNSDNGFLSGFNELSTITMQRCVFAFNGIGAGGLTHNFYVGHAGHAIADQVLSFSTAQVHEGKWRSRITTVSNSVFADGQNGVPGSSSCLDFPLAGLVSVTNTVLHKGPCPNGDTDMVQYGEEAPGQNGPAWDVNVLTLDGVTFLNTAAPGSTSSAVCAVNFMQGSVVPCVSPTTGIPATIIVKNSRFYNIPKDQWFSASAAAAGNTITDGGGNTFLTTWPGLQPIDPSTGVLLTQAHKPGPGYDAGYIGIKGDHGIVLDALELETRIPAGAAVGSRVTQFYVYDQAGKPLASQAWSLPADQVNVGAFAITASGQLNVAQGGLADGLLWAKAQVTGTDSFGAAQGYTKYIYVVVGTGHVPGLATQGGAVLAA